MFLKPVVSRMIGNRDELQKINELSNDKEILDALKRTIPFETISTEFKKYYGVDLVDIENKDIELDLVETFDVETLRKVNILPYLFDESRSTYYFAIDDFLNENLRNSVTSSSKAMGKRARFSFAPKSIIEDKYLEITKNLQTKTMVENNKVQEEVIEVIDNAPGEFNAQEWVDEVLDVGIELGASDVHIEKLEETLQVRYRVDGKMTNKKKYNLDLSQVANIFVRLKVISDMNISERRKPQDGRVDNYKHKGEIFDMRVSTVSTIHGEKAVLRLTNKGGTMLTYEDLGFSDRDAAKVRSILSNKNGILYVAGATGSGKTTTLYSMIDELNQDTVNIYTIEDPVEKTIDNINQIQVEPAAGITFPSTLKALLRQDPDVIIVGEIRDKETAELSVQSSLTGHLVLSTIHANNALESINRLLNMGVESYMVSGSSLGFLSQRLVRKVCPYCKVPHGPLNAVERSWVEKIESEHNINIDTDKIVKEKGCDKCISGYKGRIAVVEIIENTPAVQDLILNNASLSEIKTQATEEGFTPLVLNGIEKLEEGSTTLSEIISELT